MSQITLYLDDATQALVDNAAHEWPQDCLGLAGRFADFPLREESSGAQVADAPRMPF